MMEVMGGKVKMDAISAEILTRPLSSLDEIENFDVNEVIAGMRQEHYYQRTLVQMRGMRRIVGDECMIGGGFFGPFTMAAQMLGVEDFMVELLVGEEEDVLKAIDFAAEIVIAYLEDLIECGLDLITVPEPAASGDLIKPSDFEKFVLPADVKVRDRLADKCPAYLIHICGKTDKLVGTVAETGMSIFSVDSINMVRAQMDSAGRCALFGNLSPAHILSNKTPDEVYAISRALLESMKPYGGFILAPGCDLAPTIPLENLQAMARAAREG
jgi:uroporphyrinogen decarboxylase